MLEQKYFSRTLFSNNRSLKKSGNFQIAALSYFVLYFVGLTGLTGSTQVIGLPFLSLTF
jgi:hypothetical protein